MAVNYNAVKKLNQAKAQKQAELAQAYEELGGSNPAYKPIQTNNVLANPQRMTATIPQLEKAVVEAYEKTPTAPTVDHGNGVKANNRPLNTARLNANTQAVNAMLDLQNQQREHRDLHQQYANLYNDILNRQASNNLFSKEVNPIASQETIMGMGNGAYGVVPGVDREDAQRLFDAQNREEKETNARNFAENHPILATLGAGVSRPIETGLGVVQNIGDYITGKPISRNYDPSSIMRNTVTENIDSNLGRLAYGGVNSILDMALAGYLGGGLSGLGTKAASRAAAAIMGTEKASDVMNDAVERGLNQDQIMAEGALSGIATGVSEAALGVFDRFLNGGSIIKNAISEGSQEVVEDLVDTLFDEVVTGLGRNHDKSSLMTTYNQYINAGYSPDEAYEATKNDYLYQLAVDGVLGGITGGLMQGGSNIAQGRNVFTGNLPTLNQQTEAQTNTDEVIADLTARSEDVINNPSVEKHDEFIDYVDEVAEKNPELEESIKEVLDTVENFYAENEANIPDSINAEVDNVNENVDNVNENDDIVIPAVEKTEQQVKNEWQTISRDNAHELFEEVGNNPLNENDIEALRYLAESEIRRPMTEYEFNGFKDMINSRGEAGYNYWVNYELASQEANNNVSPDDIFEKYGIDLVNPDNVTEQGQQAVRTAPEIRVPRREISNVRRTTEQLRNNLDIFSDGDIDVQPLIAQLDEAYSNVVNTSGNAQAEAVQNFNNVVNAINEQMSGATLNQSARDFNEDGYNRMRNVTDGRRIAITPAQLESTGYRTLRELNSAVYSGKPNSVRFFAEGALNTVPLDNVYNEMRYLSNNELPAVLAGDQLNTLVNYITQYKSGKNDTVEVANWDRMNSDSRTSAEATIDDLADDTLDKLEDGTITAEEMSEVFNKLSELQRKNPRLAEKVSQLYEQLSAAMMERVSNASVYDEDIENATEDTIDELAEEIVGEIPRSHNDTAGVKTGRFRQSRFFEGGTAEKGGMINDKIRELDKKYGHMMYENNTEPESMAKASEEIETKGIDNETRRLMEKDRNGQYWNNVETDEMMMIYHDAKEYAESLDENGEDSEEAWGYAYDILESIKNQASLKGQALQALAKWSRSNTPEGLYAEAVSIIETAKRGENWESAVERETRGAVNYDENGKPTRSMDIGFMKDFMKEAKKLEAINSGKRFEELIKSGMNEKQATRTVNREYKHIYDNLGRMINTQIPSGMVERVRTLLMDNMLGNARTLITRNAGGNIGFNLVEQLLRKPLSAVIDSAVSKARGTTRTVGDVNLFTKEGRELYKAYGEGAKEALGQEIYDFAHGIHSSRSGETNLSNAVGNNRTVFKNNKTNQSKGLNYILNKADNLVRYGLSLGDRWAYEATYSQTLAELQQLYDQGKLTRKFTTKSGQTITEQMTEAQFRMWAEEQAKINALEACYQDDSEMAQAFLAARKLVNKLSRATIGVDVLSQFTIPFAKTPANIIQRAVEYSPLGLAKNAIQTIREINSDTGLNQRRFSVDTSRNIIGSALFALGMLAAKSGVLTGGYSEDKDMREAQKEAGMQEYALNTGDKNISIDWIPVLGNNAVASAAFYNAMQNNPELSMGQRLGRGLSEGLKTQFESSALQGLNRFISGSNSYSGNNGDLVSNAQDTLKSGLTQFIPSLLRQYAAATDPYRRQLSGANPDDYYRNAILNSIPGLRETLDPRVSRTGEYIEQNAGRTQFQKWMDNFLNPATVTMVNNEEVRDEAMRLYESTGNNVAFEPNVSIGDLKVDDHVPTAQEYTEYQQAAYGNMNQAASDFINSDYYQTLNDGERESTLADIYSAIKSVEKLNTLGGDKDKLNGAAKAYDEGGVDGLINYMIARNTMAQMGMSNNANNREQILEVLNQGGYEAVQEMVDHSTELQEAGIDSYNLQLKYDHATNYIPSLTPGQFMETWSAMDSNSNDTVSQDEILAYLNQNPTSWNESDVNMYWQAYLQNPSYQPYFDSETGTWKKHKG